jgi:hypothetical protein
MKQIIGNYSFSTSAKTITLTDFTTIRLDRIELIVDVTTNKILYNFADNTVASATVATNVITLSALQGGENNSDKLEIFYDAIAGDPIYDRSQASLYDSAGNALAAVTTSDATVINSRMLMVYAKVGAFNGSTMDILRSASTAAATTGAGLLGVGPLGIYNSSAPTVTSGQYERLQLDSSANLKVTVNTALPTGTNSIGQVTVNAGMNLNTSALALESGGNLATIAGAVSSSKFQANISQVGGNSVATAATGVQQVGIVGHSGVALDAVTGVGSAPNNMIVTGLIYNTSPVTPATGNSMSLQADQAGSLRVFPGIAYQTMSTWTSATALNATQTIFSNSGAAAVLVQVDQTTTLTAGAITFEVSGDGATWITAPANTVLDATSATYTQISLPYTLQANTNKSFLILSNGWQNLRIKLSTAITGTGTVIPYYALLPFNPVQQMVAFSPTAANFQVTANAGTNLNTSALALESGGNLATLAGAVSSSVMQNNIKQINGQTAANSQLTGSLAVGGGAATGTALTSTTYPLLMAGSDYGGTPAIRNWKVDSSGNGQINISQVGGNAVSTATTGVQLVGMADGSGNALASTTGSDGTSVGSRMLEVYAKTGVYNGSTMDIVRSANTARATTGTGVPAAGVLGMYNSSLPTVTNGQYERLQMDINGRVIVNNGLMPLGTALNTYETQITTNTTTTPTSSTAYVSSITICISSAGASSNTITIRDKQATPVVLVNAMLTTTASTTPTVINFQTPIKMTSGIDIITATGTAGTVNVWIDYYQ